jgi:hypothetical protein
LQSSVATVSCARTVTAKAAARNKYNDRAH